ncbi:MAG: hypothetical protein ACE5G0_18995 [Rhodothermales bacterium]
MKSFLFKGVERTSHGAMRLMVCFWIVLAVGIGCAVAAPSAQDPLGTSSFAVALNENPVAWPMQDRPDTTRVDTVSTPTPPVLTPARTDTTEVEQEDGVEVSEAITMFTYIFFVYLLLALFVERSVEVLMAGFKYLELKLKLRSFWNKKAERLRARFERIYGFQGGRDRRAQKVLDWVYWQMVTEKTQEGGARVVSADLLRLYNLRIGTRVLAFLIALVLVIVLWDRSHLNLIQLLAEFYDVALPGGIALVEEVLERDVLSKLVAAVAITIGTEPLHNLIARIEKLEKKKTAKQGGAP